MVDQLHRLAEALGPRRFVHMNSTTAAGGGGDPLPGGGPALNFDGPDSDEVRRFFIDNALFSLLWPEGDWHKELGSTEAR